MNTLIHIMGVIGIFIIGAGLVFFGTAALTESITNLVNTFRYDTEELTKRKLGERIVCESYWLNNPEHRLAVKVLGEMLSNGQFDGEKLRNKLIPAYHEFDLKQDLETK